MTRTNVSSSDAGDARDGSCFDHVYLDVLATMPGGRDYMALGRYCEAFLAHGLRCKGLPCLSRSLPSHMQGLTTSLAGPPNLKR
jgi:hypothetical protein